MSWKHMGGLNPKFSEFKDKHQDLSLLGLGWALYWRFLVLVLAIEVAAVTMFVLAMTAMGNPLSDHHKNWRDDRNTAPMHGKLNINVVCEDALAYMTFTDAASADAFVEECKAGEHPEVIEKYKQNMDLGANTTI